MARYFELLGLPGAGKTSLLRHWRPHDRLMTVHQLVRRERIRAAERHRYAAIIRKLPKRVQLRLLDGPVPDPWDTAQMAIDYPQLHDVAVRISRKLPSEDDQRVALWMLVEALTRYGFVQRVCEPREGVVMDEGIWQRLLFPFAALGADASLMRCLPDRLPHFDGVVVLDLPLEIAVRRVVNRNAEFQATDVMPAMARLLPHMIESLRARAIPLTILDATRPPHESLAGLRRFLTEQSE